MPIQLTDDGEAIVLDLHGATIAQARDLLSTTIRVACERGRATVRIIHGSSTSDGEGREATIKSAIKEDLHSGLLPAVTGHVAAGGVTILSLPLGRPRDNRRIRLLDVW